MGNHVKLDTGIIFLLFTYILMYGLPVYCTQVIQSKGLHEPLTIYIRPVTFTVPCFTITTHPDDSTNSDYSPAVTTTYSGVVYHGSATTSMKL